MTRPSDDLLRPDSAEPDRLDELVHEALRGELDEAGEVALARLCEQDPTAAERADALRQDDDLLRSLPELRPPPDLHGRIMERVRAAARARAGWRTFRGYALAASIAFLLGGLTVWAALRQSAPAVPAIEHVRPPPLEQATATEPAAAAPVEQGHPVRFVYVDESARRVQLVGDFDGWGEQQLLLRPTDVPGVFEATVVLPPGEHQYMFVLDGERWVPDPLADRQRRDSFGRTNSLVEI